jgi:MoaA/NifB/PqqE/SkfB family radical SAM enzyme
MLVPTLDIASETMRRHWEAAQYPRLVYVETTNFCNARCRFCLYDRMERPVVRMSLDRFKRLAEKVSERGVKIGAMFCFGEPLADAELFQKIAYGRRIGVLTEYQGLNTNVSLLTRDRWDEILENCSNITLSFANTGARFEELTGLKWNLCYKNAINFIEYRDRTRPEFQVEIGCNDVTGHDREAVRRAFDGYLVDWARDAEIQWGSKVITGVIDRSIFAHSLGAEWTCDGYKGALQVKPNGDCVFCAYDVIRSETRFANIFSDSWDAIEAGFKSLWREPSSLCLRCEFWWNYHQMVAGGWKRGPSVDPSWQRSYDSIEPFWNEQHDAKNIRFLTGSSLAQIVSYLEVGKEVRRANTVLEIGVGTGSATRALASAGKTVLALDVSRPALDAVSDVAPRAFTAPADLPSGEADLALCFLVAQHLPDVDLFLLVRHAIRCLRPEGLLAIQYASPADPTMHVYSETAEQQRMGRVQRTREHMARVIRASGGEVATESETKVFSPEAATDDNTWNGVLVRRTSG